MSPREAVCQYMGWEFGEASDYRYHYGRTAIPIYSTRDGYVCCTAIGKKPPKGDDIEWGWIEATGSQAEYVKSNGKIIWISK